MQSCLSLAFSAWTKAHACQGVTPLDFTAILETGTTGKLQIERDHNQKVEGIAAVAWTSQRNSHAKMLAPPENSLWNWKGSLKINE